MSILRRLFSFRPKVSAHKFDAALAPDMPFYAVGDIHGCERLLSKLLDTIAVHSQTDQTPIIFVGDYVDRGEQSAAVLRRLFQMVENSPETVVCLAGNHEDMMLKFIDGPDKHGPRWLKYGGLQTLASFGIRGITTGSAGRALVLARDELVAEMGEALVTWLRELPIFWQSGNIAVIHAGADPTVPIKEQSAHILKWGHKLFDKQTREDGVWVLHGHTIVGDAKISDGKISIDTGAYATGKLTAAYVSNRKTEFLLA